MSHFNDAKELVNACKATFDEIKDAYSQSLHEKSIKPTLLIKIKNFMENLRSALDFSAHGLFDKYGTSTDPNPNIYFPYAWETLDQAGFRTKQRIEKGIPGLTTERPDIAVKLESYQHFSGNDNAWLPKFTELNNENKHQKLTPQERKEIKELRIRAKNTEMRIMGDSTIKLGKNAHMIMGEGMLGEDAALITGEQTISADKPARIIGNARQEIVTWVSFIFSTNKEPVLPLLERALKGTANIVDELSTL